MPERAFAVGAVDKHAWGFGARAYFDYVVSPALYLNLYSEFIYLPIGIPVEETKSLRGWQLPGDVNYGYDLTLEAEPHYETDARRRRPPGFGLPVTFSMSPELEIDGTPEADTDATLLTLGPNVSLFLMKTLVPLEFELSYTLPLLGKNTDASQRRSSCS